MYKNDPAFKIFADERIKLLASLKLEPSVALGNVCNYGSHPDEFNKNKMKGFHYWLRDNIDAVAKKKTPATPPVYREEDMRVFMPEE